jgi:hypothetical protein
MTSHSSDPKAKELLALSEEVSRVADSLAQLALKPAPRDAIASGVDDASQRVLAKLIHARRERSGYLPEDLLGEPVWDMLLHLLHEEMNQSQVPLSSALEAAGAPQRVAVRWLNALAQRRLVRLSTDAAGQEIVELAPNVSAGLRRYIRDVIAS